MVRHAKSMGASTAGVLSFLNLFHTVKTWYWQGYFGHTSLLLTILICFTGLMAFQRLLLLEYGGGPEKDRDVCFCVGGTLRMLSSDSSCQQDVLWHDGNSPGMDGTQVGIVKQSDKVSLCRFLETQYRC